MAQTDHPINPDVELIEGTFYEREPFDTYRWMRDNAPAYWDEPSGIWGISRYNDILKVAKDPETFSNTGGIRPATPPLPHLIDLDDPEHKKRRGLVNKGFTVRQVQAREPRIREICRGLIDKAVSKGEFDFVMDFAAWLPLIVIGDMLGIDPADHATLLRWSDELVCGASANDPVQMEKAALTMFEYTDYEQKVIADRRARPRQDDLISILVHAEIDGKKLSEEQLLYESLLLLVGGDETTRHVIVGGMYELLRKPELFAALVEDQSRIPMAVEEMLRWVTPIKNMARTATRDVELHGQTIEEGEKLLLLYDSANRDERAFERPMDFNIGRHPNEHIAFGWGPHFCLGASLARLELRVMFEEVARAMPGLRLVGDGPPPRRPSNFITGITHLPVSLAA